MSSRKRDWALWSGAVAWGVLATWAVAKSLQTFRTSKGRTPQEPDDPADTASEDHPKPNAAILFLEDESQDPCSEVTLTELRRLFGVERSDLNSNGTVLISESVFQRILAHVRSDTSVELGGVLFGRALHLQECGCLVTVITHAAAGHGARSGAASLEIGTEAWSSILADANGATVDDPVVGWYHSHPGLGVFLSGVDRRTQQAHFPHEWSVALVVDPVSDRIGAFTGPNGASAALIRTNGEGERVPARQERCRLFGELRLGR